VRGKGVSSESVIKPITKFHEKIGVYLSVRTCEVFLCFIALVKVRVYYVTGPGCSKAGQS